MLSIDIAEKAKTDAMDAMDKALDLVVIMRKIMRKIDVLCGFIATDLKNYFGFQDNSKLCAHTYCEVDYFRKDPKEAHVSRIKS